MNDVSALNVSMSTYSVVPWKDANGLLKCLYFDESNTLVPADQLDCNAQGGTVDFVRLKAHEGPLPASIGDRYAVVDNATLFAAVVKTRTRGTGLANTYMADSKRGLVLPVMPLTARSTILIFMLESPAIGPTYSLIATADPEIKNSSGGNT